MGSAFPLQGQNILWAASLFRRASGSVEDPVSRQQDRKRIAATCSHACTPFTALAPCKGRHVLGEIAYLCEEVKKNQLYKTLPDFVMHVGQYLHPSLLFQPFPSSDQLTFSISCL